MKGIYLFACKARHENYDLDYADNLFSRKSKLNYGGLIL